MNKILRDSAKEMTTKRIMMMSCASHPAEADARLLQRNSEHSHEQPEGENAVARARQDLLAGGLGVDVGAVDVVRDQRAHSDQLSRAGRRHSPARHRGATMRF